MLKCVDLKFSTVLESVGGYEIAKGKILIENKESVALTGEM